MNMNKMIGILFSITIIISLAVYAAPGNPEGAAQDGYASSNNSTTSALTVTAQGGNYTHLNVSTNEQTSNWQLFYGTLSSQLLLKDGNSNVAYTWSGSNTITNGYIFFATSNTIDFTDTFITAQTHRENEDTTLGLTSEVDSVNSTFTETTHPTINFGAESLTGAVTVKTSNTTHADAWLTTLIRDSSNNFAYTGFFNDSNNVAFNNQPADYQVLVPTGASPRTYYVYLALE